MHRLTKGFFDQKGLSAELHGVVVPCGGATVVVAGGGAMLCFDGILLAGLFLDHIKHAGDPERFGRECDATAGGDAAVTSGLVGEFGRIDPTMVEESALNVFVHGHHTVHVLEVKEPRAVRDLVQGSDRERIACCRHDAP